MSLLDTPEQDLVRAAGLSRRDLLRIGGLTGLGAFLAACGAGPGDRPEPGAATTPTGPAVRGGTLTWALVADPATLTPFGVGNTSSVEVKNLVYESLVGWDKDLKVVPVLAESWTTPNPTTYEFTLRKNVFFHSGKELDSGDVKYSFELQKAPPAPGNVTAFYPKIASIETPDKYTVRFTMAQPDGTLLGYCAWLAYSFVVPAGLYDRVDTRSNADGTGPFMVRTYVPNDRVELARHPKYWQPDLPHPDALTLKVLPDVQARLANLVSGTIDGTTLSSDVALTLAGNANVEVLKGPTAAFRELHFSLRGGKPWDDVRVRQAINLVVDRQKLIDNVYGGDASYTSKIPPSYGSWPIPQDQLKSNYEKVDVAKAKQLMADAGQSGGFSVTMQAISSPDDYVQIAQILAEQLKQININVTVQPLEIGTFAKNDSAGSFEWSLTGRGMRGDPSGYFTDFDPQGSTAKAWFAGGYSNTELNGLIYASIAETDQAKRATMYTRMQEIVLTEWPTMPLVAPSKFQAVRKRLQNMYVSVDDTERGLAQAWVTG
ncbi:ABC transporter substrate-binding protein [Pseudonocardia sp. GCM10023141]|uniref:ABC transporter substrate-binding protein n=1 Tax=Pseudonocardia sp. GCM10023141 TaxID=3252653 RepID=UPI003611F2C8